MTDTADKITLEPFQREERYIVIKRKSLSDFQEHLLRQYLAEGQGDAIPTVECVVVESDWSIYEQVWALVEQEATGTRPPISSPVAGELVELLEALDCHTDADDEVWLTINEKGVSGQGAVRIGSEKRIVSQCFAKWKEKRDAILTALQAQPAVEQPYYDENGRCPHGIRKPWACDECDALATHQGQRAAALDEPRQEIRDLATDLAKYPCHNADKEDALTDLEGGCCGPCRARQTIHALSKETEG